MIKKVSPVKKYYPAQETAQQFTKPTIFYSDAPSQHVSKTALSSGQSGQLLRAV
jgi:hypothetical protein